LAIGVTGEGDREVLGIWWQETAGAKFWLAVLNDLHQRGVADVLIACVDGLTGFPEAIEGRLALHTRPSHGSAQRCATACTTNPTTSCRSQTAPSSGCIASTTAFASAASQATSRSSLAPANWPASSGWPLPPTDLAPDTQVDGAGRGAHRPPARAIAL
jgi:hypothetical protein